MITVFVVDDDPAVRHGVSGLLERESDIEVVGGSAPRENVLGRIAVSEVDVVVIGESAGIDFARAVRWTVRRAGCLLMIAFDDDRAVYDAVLGGAVGFVLMDVRGRGLAIGVRDTAAGRPLVSARSQEHARGELRHGSDCLRIDVLDPIERDVIAKAAAGLSDDRIAQTLGLEPAAIRSAFASALGKLGLPRARAAFTLPDPSRP